MKISYSFELSSQTEFKNIAKYGVATQESTGYNGDAEKAIDGNTNWDYVR